MNLSDDYSKRQKKLSGIIQEDRKRIGYIRARFLSKYLPKQRKQAEVIFNQIVASDPSKNKQYSQWLLNLFSIGSLKLEDLYKATEYLYVFDELKRKNVVPANKKDIGKFTSIQELHLLISELGGTGEIKNDEKYLIEDRFFINNKQAELIFENNKWLVVVPKTFEASQFYGCSSQWCTKFPDQFKNYSKDGHLLVIIDKTKLNHTTNDRRFQFHFPSDQFMDFGDHPINLNEFLKEHPDIIFGMSKFIIEAIDSGYNVLNKEEKELVTSTSERQNYLEFEMLPENIQKLIFKRIIDKGVLVNRSWLDMMDKKNIPLYIDNRLRKNGVIGFENIWDLTDNRQKMYYFKIASSKGNIIPEKILDKSDKRMITFYLNEISKKAKILPDFIFDRLSADNKSNYLNGISNLTLIDMFNVSHKQVSQLGDDRTKKIIDKTMNRDISKKFRLPLTNEFFDGLSEKIKNYYIGKIFQIHNGDEKFIVNVLTKHQLQWGREFGFLS